MELQTADKIENIHIFHQVTLYKLEQVARSYIAIEWIELNLVYLHSKHIKVHHRLFHV